MSTTQQPKIEWRGCSEPLGDDSCRGKEDRIFIKRNQLHIAQAIVLLMYRQRTVPWYTDTSLFCSWNVYKKKVPGTLYRTLLLN